MLSGDASVVSCLLQGQVRPPRTPVFSRVSLAHANQALPYVLCDLLAGVRDPLRDLENEVVVKLRIRGQ